MQKHVINPDDFKYRIEARIASSTQEGKILDAVIEVIPTLSITFTVKHFFKIVKETPDFREAIEAYNNL